MPKGVFKSKGEVPSAPPAQSSSEPPKAVSTKPAKVVKETSKEPQKAPAKAPVKAKRRRKPKAEEVAAADRNRFRKLYEDTVERYGRTLNQISRIR